MYKRQGDDVVRCYTDDTDARCVVYAGACLATAGLVDVEQDGLIFVFFGVCKGGVCFERRLEYSCRRIRGWSKRVTTGMPLRRNN